ncbi:MAG: UDP-glucose--hexose-1-phosphate uridylyltransferase [Candidatus Marinimicrobia bacterium]|nr:UDP-glucose--hexose-1-phosphate uridylyltransferase [Candidatus Neomarinimicrobiota bacterium]
MSMEFFQSAHRRLNLLTGDWVLVSPHRLQRPWVGRVEQPPPEELPEYDPDCYLCPGNKRAGGRINPDYKGVFVFDNDFPALLMNKKRIDSFSHSEVLFAKGEIGLCRVVCFSHFHNKTLPELDSKYLINLVEEWKKQYEEIAEIPEIKYITIFENKGEIMGCSNPHPHGQIWAQSSIPVEPYKELVRQRGYFHGKKRCLLCDYLETELKLDQRIVVENDSFVVLVPFWAIWPYEVMIVSKRHIPSIGEFNNKEILHFAEILKLITIKYDNLFNIPFPYSAGMHNCPTDSMEYPEWHFHMHFYPPLLRSATIKKFMVGYEMLSEPQRDLTAEESTKRLKSLSTKHYKEK